MPSKKQREQLLNAGRCVMCGKKPENEKPICQSCKDRYKTRRAERRSKNLCTKCGKNTPQQNRTTCTVCIEKYDAWLDSKGEQYKRMVKERNSIQRQDRKQKVVDHYGGRCACCEEKGLVFLNIDHIDENGAEHRRQIAPHFKNRVPGGDHFYRWLEKNNFPDGFQTLCYNCNIGKHWNNGVCPHQTGV